MIVLFLGNTHDQTTSIIASHHIFWKPHKIEVCRTWHAIIALRQHKLSDNVRCGMLSSPLNRIHCRKTSSVAFHHSSWITHTIGLHHARHAIMDLGQKTQRDKFGRRIPTSPLDNTRRKTTSGLAGHYFPWITCTVG